jgi:uncharacterized membrane protein
MTSFMTKKKNNLIAMAVVFVLSVLIFVFVPQNFVNPENQIDQESLNAKIVKINELENDVQEIISEVTNGSIKGRQVTVMEDSGHKLNRRGFKEGDKIILTHDLVQDVYYISEYNRSNALFVLFLLFIGVVLLVSGLQGFGSIIGMVFSFVVLFKIILPMILNGFDPVWVAIVGALFIIPTTFFSSHGFNKKTIIAVFGTILSLVLVGILASLSIDFGKITGLASEESSFLSMTAVSKIDFKGLVLAGMIIGIMGILDDVTVSQSSVVQQLKESKKDMGFKELYFRSMAVGKDHISSVVNTLVLIYAGSALPLMLLFLDYSSSFYDVVNIEMISEEIIRTLIGSIGLILAVPITTLLAAGFFSRQRGL